MLNKYTVLGLCYVLTLGMSHAGVPPLTLSGPIPSIATSVLAGDPATSYAYTVTNQTNVNIPITESVSGNSTSVTVTSPCTVVPAHQTCTFFVTLDSTFNDVLLPQSMILDVIHVTYHGRLPGELTSAFDVTVVAPQLTSLVISPSSASILGGQIQAFRATGTFTNGAVFDVTAATTWTSSDASVALIGAQTGLALGITTGSTSITGTYQFITSNSATLSVINQAYVVNQGAGSLVVCAPQSNGTFTNCTTQSGFTSPFDVAVDPTTRVAYVTEPSSNQVLSCDLSFTTCTPTGSNFTLPSGITFDPAGQYVYVVNANEVANSSVTSCQHTIQNGRGQLINCTVNTIEATENAQFFSRIIVHHSGLYAYLLLHDDAGGGTGQSLLVCYINPLNGTFDACRPTGAVGTAPAQNNTGLAQTPASQASGDNYLYISTAGSQGGQPTAIYYCPITNIQTGEVGTCAQMNATGLNVPEGLSISQNGLYAFIADSGSDLITYCEFNGDSQTSFIGCATALTEAGGSSPKSVVLN